MTQRNLLTHRRFLRIGRESSFATTATDMLALLVKDGPLLGGLTTEMLARMDLSVYQHANQAPVAGLERGGPVQFSVDLKALATRLDGAASAPAAVTASSALSHQVLLDHWLGGSGNGRGSDVVSSTNSSIDVTGGHGSRFAVGQPIIVIDGSGGYQVRRITSIATDTLNVSPDWSSNPSAGHDVLNAQYFYREESHTQTLTVEQATGGDQGTPEAQRRARGTYGQCAWTAQIGAIPTLAFSAQSAAHDGPGDLSIPTTAQTDDMGAPLVWQGESYWWSGSTAPSHTCTTEVGITVENQWTVNPCGGNASGIGSVVMTGGRTAPVRVQLKTLFDAAHWTAFSSGTERSLLLITSRGSGSSQRFAGWLFPRVVIVAEPQETPRDRLQDVTVELLALMPSDAGSTTALARSPAIFFLA